MLTNKSDLSDSSIKELSLTLIRQKRLENLEKVETVLKFIGAGALLGASIVAPNLIRLAKPIIDDLTAEEPWERYNIRHLKRTLGRLEKQNLVVKYISGNQQVVELTEAGRRKIYKFALDEIKIKSPRSWDGTWWMISYDIPEEFKNLRDAIREYLEVWGFYKIQESVFLHAYPCQKEVEFLRGYLGVGKYVRVFRVSKIENDAAFREYFNV